MSGIPGIYCIHLELWVVPAFQINPGFNSPPIKTCEKVPISFCCNWGFLVCLLLPEEQIDHMGFAAEN